MLAVNIINSCITDCEISGWEVISILIHVLFPPDTSVNIFKWIDPKMRRFHVTILTSASDVLRIKWCYPMSQHHQPYPSNPLKR